MIETEQIVTQAIDYAKAELADLQTLEIAENSTILVAIFDGEHFVFKYTPNAIAVAGVFSAISLQLEKKLSEL